MVISLLRAEPDPLLSWNDGSAKQAIVDFVSPTTETGGSKFVPPKERIATSDQDGTLWVEYPIYSQMMYCLDRVPVLANEKPELKNVEPFKTVLAGVRPIFYALYSTHSGLQAPYAELL